jgi:circadian clock protein KaiC
MTDTRLRSGHQPLDDVLGSGLPANGISIIMGLPGTGKTIVAQQYAFTNASADHPVVYFSTVSEPLEKIVRFGQSLSFFDASAVGKSVFYSDLGQTAAQDGLPGVAEQIPAVLRERRPGLIVIDSFRALRAFAADDADFRRFLHQLARRLTAYPVACLWVGEYDAQDIALLPEFAVADAILDLTTVRTEQRDMRYLKVRKLRGSGFLSGGHAYRLGSDGLQLFPRLADIGRQENYRLGDQRITSGIAALDDMLEGGVWPGASTMVAGPAGAGKTMLGLHFIFGGLARGEAGVVATLQEHPTQLRRMVRNLGWPSDDPRVQIMYRSPVDIYIDEWVHELLGIVDSTGARRVLLDSLGDLRVAAPDETRFKEFLYSLTQRLSRQGINLFMTFELADLFETKSLSDSAVSHLSDNVILLNYFKAEGSVNRAISVIKSRASGHDPHMRQFTIDEKGITIADIIAPPGNAWM